MEVFDGRQEYKRHNWEFKLEAVGLAALRERPKAQILFTQGIEALVSRGVTILLDEGSRYIPRRWCSGVSLSVC